MCVYCYCGDEIWKWDRPWNVPTTDPDYPFLPKPIAPEVPNEWNLQRLREYLELLRRIKALEDQIGCPCEPNKADYIKMFEDRISELERRMGEQEVKEMFR